MNLDEAKLQAMFDAQTASWRGELRETIELEFAEGFGQLYKHFDKRFDKFETKLDTRVNDIYVLVDKFSGRMDNDIASARPQLTARPAQSYRHRDARVS